MSLTEIIRIPILPFNIVNAHLIRGEAGCILVDAGIPGSERRIARVLARHGLSFRDIKLIIVTHAHTDHAGSAARLRQLSGAPILAHKDDADFYSRKEPMAFCPTGRAGKIFLKTPMPHQPYEGFEPDIRMVNGRHPCKGLRNGRAQLGATCKLALHYRPWHGSGHGRTSI